LLLFNQVITTYFFY